MPYVLGGNSHCLPLKKYLLGAEISSVGWKVEPKLSAYNPGTFTFQMTGIVIVKAPWNGVNFSKKIGNLCKLFIQESFGQRIMGDHTSCGGGITRVWESSGRD